MRVIRSTSKSKKHVGSKHHRAGHVVGAIKPVGFAIKYRKNNRVGWSRAKALFNQCIGVRPLTSDKSHESSLSDSSTTARVAV
jgi:hypothetical protein